MKALDLRTVAEAVGGCLCGSQSVKVSVVGTDSRDFKGKNLFFALKGDKYDGHVYLKNVAECGARAAVVEKGNKHVANFKKEYSAFPLIEVDDTLFALGELASYVRSVMDVVSIGITGTTGKTCTKDFLVSILSRESKVCFSEESYNNEIGTPLTVLKARPADEILVCEMGARHQGDIKRLTEIVKPRHGIITNIGPGHLELFGDERKVAETKCELASSLPESGRLFIKAADEWTRFISARTRAGIVKFGYDRSADYRATDVKLDDAGKTRFTIEGPGISISVVIPIAGRHNIENALAAASCAHQLGVEPAGIAEGLKKAKLSKWRTQLQKAPGGFLIINDTYNANPQSMMAALNTLSELGGSRRKIAVLGSMEELGEHSPGYHFEIGRAIARLDIDVLIAVGGNAKEYITGALESGLPRGSVFMSADSAGALKYLRAIAEPDDIVLVKASRVVGLDYIVSTIMGNGSIKEKLVSNV